MFNGRWSSKTSALWGALVLLRHCARQNLRLVEVIRQGLNIGHLADTCNKRPQIT
ncbi:hypothetical protein MMC2321_00345 [Chitinophaga sp. MM2321]